MNIERKDFLTVAGLLPARLDVQETAWYLGLSRPARTRTGMSWPANGGGGASALMIGGAFTRYGCCGGLRQNLRLTLHTIRNGQSHAVTRQR